MNKSDLRKKAQSLVAMVRIGKSGITAGVIEEIKNQLKLHHLIKIKLLKSASDSEDRKQLAAKIAENTNSEVIAVVGNSLVLWDRKNYK